MSGIQAIQHYLTARKLQPLVGLGNEIHAIHRGTTYEAIITIEDLEAAVLENWQLRGALGYEVPADIPEGEFKCGLCEARREFDASLYDHNPHDPKA